MRLRDVARDLLGAHQSLPTLRKDGLLAGIGRETGELVHRGAEVVARRS